MHRSNSELVEHLYGVAGHDEHLEECTECQGRLEQMRAARQSFLALPAEIPADFLAAQRKQIWQRIEGRRNGSRFLQPLVAATATLALVAGFFLWTPARQRLPFGAPQKPDYTWLAEVAAEANTSVPRSMRPLGRIDTPAVVQVSRVIAKDSSADSRLFDEIEEDLSNTTPRAVDPLRSLYSEAE